MGRIAVQKLCYARSRIQKGASSVKGERKRQNKITRKGREVTKCVLRRASLTSGEFGSLKLYTRWVVFYHKKNSVKIIFYVFFTTTKLYLKFFFIMKSGDLIKYLRFRFFKLQSRDKIFFISFLNKTVNFKVYSFISKTIIL